MLFAMNYSEPAAALVRAGRIPMDRFKCPDWPWLVDEARLVRAPAVHFTLTAGLASLRDVNWALVEELLEQTHTPYVNLHLEATTLDYPGLRPDAIKPKARRKVIEGMSADVREVVQRFGAGRVIVENVPYRGQAGRVLKTAAEPEVIRGIIEENGCGLLLDISHARISAHHLGMDAHEYIEALPVQALREMHITGLHLVAGQLKDHLEMLPGDWPFMEWAVERIRSGAWARPWLLAYEYGGVGEKFAWRSDPERMQADAPRLHALLQGIPV